MSAPEALGATNDLDELRALLLVALASRELALLLSAPAAALSG